MHTASSDGGFELDVGADLRDRCRDAPDELRAEVLGAVARHRVVFVPGCATALADFKALVGALGEVSAERYVDASPDAPGFVRIDRDVTEGAPAPYGWHWHSDGSFLPSPPTYTALLAVEADAGCGPTLWADQVLAWLGLSDRLREVLRAERAVHESLGWDAVRGTHARDVLRRELASATRPGTRSTTHPVVVRTTGGDEALYVNESYTTSFAGWREWESIGLLERLFRWQTRDELVCRRRWEPGLVAVWDNRAVVHRATDGAPGARRVALRATFDPVATVRQSAGDGAVTPASPDLASS